LFNGSDLNEWQGDTEKYVPRDGILVCEKGGKILETKKDYSDFVFRFEFKLEESGNIGIGGEKVSLLEPWQVHGDENIKAHWSVVELQHHGSELFFKNLYIRELPY
jgi:hypothetical protein